MLSQKSHWMCGAVASIMLSCWIPASLADPATTAPAASQPTTGPSVVTWDQAAAHVGETATISGPVMGTHAVNGGKSLVLNIGKDFPDVSRFTIMINGDKDPISADTYTGKTVTVTGKIEMYRKVPEIKTTTDGVTVAN